LTTATADIQNFIPRNFRGGVKFRTLCASCNNKLGTFEDKAIKDFFTRVSTVMRQSSIVLLDERLVEAIPNRIFRAVLAYVSTANDRGNRSALDEHTLQLFNGIKSIQDIPYKIYYWPYTGPWLTVIRDSVISYNFFKDALWMCVIKFKPIGFAVTALDANLPLPCLNNYLTRGSDELAYLPLLASQSENDLHWPANPGSQDAVMASSESVSFIAAASWRGVKPKR
jgi:hypothetical protein